MDTTTWLESLLGIGIVLWRAGSKDSEKRKSPDQRLTDSTPDVLLCPGKVVQANGIPGFHRRHNCKMRFKEGRLEIYRTHDFRPDNLVCAMPYQTLTGIGWRNRVSQPIRTSLIVGNQVGNAYIGKAVRLPTPPPIGYTTIVVESGRRDIVVECPAIYDQVLRDLVLPAIRTTGGNPKVETYDY